MNIRQLEVFWAIMRTGSVTGAAQMLGISQPAVSRILRHTEDQLRMKLFIRRSGRIHPTEEANHLFVIAETIFDNISKVRQAALDFRDSLSGRMQIAATPNLAATFLPLPVAHFMKDRPRVELSVKVLTTTQVTTRVSLHQADVGILYGPVKDPSIVAEDLCAMDLICLMKADNPLAMKSEIHAADLEDERIISFHRTTPPGGAVRSLFRTVLPDKTIDVECDHSIVALSLVHAGMGTAIVPPLLHLSHVLPDVVVRPFRPAVSITPLVIYRKMPSISRLTAALIKELHEFADRQACAGLS